jgi:YfiH family protein
MPLDFLTHEFLENDQISHGFFGRQGGVSHGIFDSLNMGLGSSDDRGNVLENRTRVAKAMGVSADQFITVNQIHSNVCHLVTEAWGFDERPSVDAMATDMPEIALGILTADCAPVLFFGMKSNGDPVVGAAHAGWCGAFNGVLEDTLIKMQDLGAVRETITAVIGPCISVASYEVGGEFYDRILTQSERNAQFFLPSVKEGHFMFDLPNYVQNRLKLAHVSNVAWVGVDTYANNDKYFSYRKATHNSDPDYGRHVSVIKIKGL